MIKDNILQETFDSVFSNFKNEALAIYGTGNNAELIVKNVAGYHF